MNRTRVLFVSFLSLLLVSCKTTTTFTHHNIDSFFGVGGASYYNNPSNNNGNSGNKVTCTKCKGKGKVDMGQECSTCMSLGHLSIKKCSKGHTIREERFNEYSMCPICKEDGVLSVLATTSHYDCPDCDDGYVSHDYQTCSLCGGSGLIDDTSGSESKHIKLHDECPQCHHHEHIH